MELAELPELVKAPFLDSLRNVTGAFCCQLQVDSRIHRYACMARVADSDSKEYLTQQPPIAEARLVIEGVGRTMNAHQHKNFRHDWKIES